MKESKVPIARHFINRSRLKKEDKENQEIYENALEMSVAEVKVEDRDPLEVLNNYSKKVHKAEEEIKNAEKKWKKSIEKTRKLKRKNKEINDEISLIYKIPGINLVTKNVSKLVSSGVSQIPEWIPVLGRASQNSREFLTRMEILKENKLELKKERINRDRLWKEKKDSSELNLNQEVLTTFKKKIKNEYNKNAEKIEVINLFENNKDLLQEKSKEKYEEYKKSIQDVKQGEKNKEDIKTLTKEMNGEIEKLNPSKKKGIKQKNKENKEKNANQDERTSKSANYRDSLKPFYNFSKVKGKNAIYKTIIDKMCQNKGIQDSPEPHYFDQTAKFLMGYYFMNEDISKYPKDFTESLKNQDFSTIESTVKMIELLSPSKQNEWKTYSQKGLELFQKDYDNYKESVEKGKKKEKNNLINKEIILKEYYETALENEKNGLDARQEQILKNGFFRSKE